MQQRERERSRTSSFPANSHVGDCKTRAIAFDVAPKANDRDEAEVEVEAEAEAEAEKADDFGVTAGPHSALATPGETWIEGEKEEEEEEEEEDLSLTISRQGFASISFLQMASSSSAAVAAEETSAT